MITATDRRVRLPLVLGILCCGLLLALTTAVSLGSTGIPMATVWQIVAHRLLGTGSVNWTLGQETVVWQIRLPRALLAAVIGAGLGLVGVAVQALARNPLADPYLLGVSSGASFGAVATIVLGLGGLLGVGIPVAAFAGALVSFVLVWGFASRGGGFVPLRLILAGVAIAHLLSGLTSYLVLQAKDEQQTRGVIFWLLGSLGGAEWSVVWLPALGVAAGLLVLLIRAPALNALLMGDETAASLGIGVGRLRRELFVITSMLTGLMVAVSGSIGFVGLMVPHAGRLVVGGDHRRLLPVAALGGALLLVIVDTAARTVLQPQEVPIGVVTALIGAPVLLFLLDRRLV